MKKTLKLIPAIAMLLISAVLVSTSTYAWFSMNTRVNATGMQIVAKSNATFLLIGEDALTTSDAIQAQTGDDLTSEALTVLDADAAQYPSKPWFNDAKDAFATGLSSMTSVTTKDTAAAVGNWYTANSTDATVWGGSGKLANATALSSFTNYVIKKTVHLTLADGSTKANNLTVTPTITIKDTYAKTTDIALDGTKTYYTYDGSAYTAVGSPVVGEIANYYEKANDISAVKVLVVTDNDVVVVLSSTNNGSAMALYSGTTTNNIDLTSTTVHHVDIYIYYDGTENAVYTNNAINLSGATINLQFDVAVHE